MTHGAFKTSRRYWLQAAISLNLMLAACASSGVGAPQASGGLFSLGDRGLGVIGAETPSALKTIAKEPYALALPPDCAAILEEIAQLDQILGPDVDVPPPKNEGTAIGRAAQHAVGGAVRGAVPYRWVLRWATRADRLDREQAAAMLAGAARRGFLKGIRRGLGC